MKIHTPRKKTILKHFADAQEVKCLARKSKIDIGLATEPRFDDGSWYFGSVLIWKEGKYACITKTKSGVPAKCKCNCKDK